MSALATVTRLPVTELPPPVESPPVQRRDLALGALVLALALCLVGTGYVLSLVDNGSPAPAPVVVSPPVAPPTTAPPWTLAVQRPPATTTTVFSCASTACPPVPTARVVPL